MSGTNTELRDFQRQVRQEALRVAEDNYAAQPHVRDFLEKLGLADMQDDHEVTVRITVPATSQEGAEDLVRQRVSAIYLPTGWSASVAS